jgi:DNA-binding response OmpR family regulator
MRKELLIVDDDPSSAGFYSRHLRLEGYGVTIAETCTDASKLLIGWRPDVIIADWWLPDADGDVWASSLRLRSDLAYVPIVVITGRDVPRATLNRLNDYHIIRYQKPFSLKEFSALVARLSHKQPLGATGAIEA